MKNKLPVIFWIIIFALTVWSLVPYISVPPFTNTYQFTSTLFIGDQGGRPEEQVVSAQKKFNEWLKTIKYPSDIISVSIESSVSTAGDGFPRELYTILVVHGTTLK